MKNTQKNNFAGPLFVVGMPRSGTKLLRDLLNNHPEIFIPPNESKIIPYLYKKFGERISRNELPNVITEWYSSTFYNRISANGYTVDKKEWIENIRQEKEVPLSNVIETFYTILSRKNGSVIWGEKTPTYLKHYSLLMHMYPKAKFIHIVRDVRDYCMSINKAWGKNMIRASFRWNENLHSFITQIGCENVLHIKYEDLINDPDGTLKGICDFVGISFIQKMLDFDKPSENLGDAKGYVSIKKDNSKKWVDNLTKGEIRRIEKVSSDMMHYFGYEPVYYSGSSIKPSVLRRSIYKMSDGIHLLKFHIYRMRGIIPAFKFMVSGYKRRV